MDLPPRIPDEKTELPKSVHPATYLRQGNFEAGNFEAGLAIKRLEEG
jgi:hypothetical protein